MKTAISIPEDLFEPVDALAQEMGVSRSRSRTVGPGKALKESLAR
jgi:metal-responsive CopG/Arc/MetJ family transcriptional regulator